MWLVFQGALSRGATTSAYRCTIRLKSSVSTMYAFDVISTAEKHATASQGNGTTCWKFLADLPIRGPQGIGQDRRKTTDGKRSTGHVIVTVSVAPVPCVGIVLFVAKRRRRTRKKETSTKPLPYCALALLSENGHTVQQRAPGQAGPLLS